MMMITSSRMSELAHIHTVPCSSCTKDSHSLKVKWPIDPICRFSDPNTRFQSTYTSKKLDFSTSDTIRIVTGEKQFSFPFERKKRKENRTGHLYASRKRFKR